MSEFTKFFLDALISWFQSIPGANITPYLWATLNGELVYGAPDAPASTAIVQTGNNVDDINTWLRTEMQLITGDAPIGWVYPGSVPGEGWATNEFQYGNTTMNRPAVFLGSRMDYTYGLLNIPERTETDVLQWYIRFDAVPDNIEQISPAASLITQYRIDKGANPNLIVLEVNQE